MTNNEISIVFHEDTGLLEMRTSGGSVMLTQLEAGLLYNLLGKLLGFRGRFKLWRMRKKLFTVASNVDPGSDQS